MNPTFEQAIEVLRQLPPPEREKVREWIDEENQKSINGKFENEKLKRDEEKFHLAMNWIGEHRDEFDGQWVALDGATLLAHGTDGKKVHAEAQSKGVKTPLMHRVSIKERQPFGGW